ncbi:DUF6493 family protein [uncultured Imperialibacter sp.]|uniref:DUF6493 family protein n=1 Tax=uncultured Imperialibacter sp. TaxID=1672639 RepID=UPI0030DD2D6D|tara:strand:- start:11537 stop:14473 length:2937 start_codon:yes stop_codon:yes gene_type:complete
MNHIERFGDILLKEKVSEIIPFLTSLEAKERKQLLPKLKELNYVWEYNTKTVTSSGFSYQQSTTPKGTDKQKTIWSIGSFYCQSFQEFSKNWGVHNFLTKDLLDEILPLFCPSWFQSYVNDAKSEVWAYIRLSYIELTDLEKQGYVELGPEIVVRTLPNVLVDSDPKNWKIRYFRPERLWQYPITLEKHIWHLFEYQSNLHWSDNYYEFQNHGGKNPWRGAFKQLVDEKRIDRNRLLKETVLAMNRNFDKNASGWFASLLFDLEPSDNEIMALQAELLAQFSSPHSKIINSSLKLIKKVQDKPGFSAQEFIVNSGLLLSSDTKSIVQSCLIILDRLAKKNPKLQQELCSQVVQAFIQQDNDLQVRAARFIEKYGGNYSSIIDDLTPYQETLMVDARAILSNALNADSMEVPLHQEDLEDVTDDFIEETPEPFEVPEGFDEFLFLASQAFDNNDPHHFDLLLAGIMQNHNKLLEGDTDKLEPALQRAIKKLIGDWTASTLYVDNIMAVFFLEYCEVLAARHPSQAPALGKMIEEAREKDLDKAKNTQYYKQRILPLEYWHTEDMTPVYFLFRELCLLVLNRVKKNQLPSLLSTPTHFPCWVDGSVLVARIVEHQKQNIDVSEADLQVALARCRKPDVLPDGVEKVEGELGALLKYHFGADDFRADEVRNPQVWLVSAIARNEPIPERLLKTASGRLHEDYYTGVFNWSVQTYRFRDRRYDYQRGKSVEFDNTRTELRVHRPKQIDTPPPPSRFFGLLKPKQEQPEIPLSVYGSQLIKEKWMVAVDNDVKRFFSLIPNHPSPLLVSVAEKALRYDPLTSETEKRTVIRTLEYLATIWSDWGDTPNEFLGIIMTCSDKTARTIAGELWVTGVTTNTIRSEQVGCAVGKVYEGNLAPVKRFSDLALTIYTISTKHKRAMFDLIKACLTELPDEPVRNLKKLLELLKETIYDRELLTKDHKLMKKLTTWKESSGLTKLVESII